MAAFAKRRTSKDDPPHRDPNEGVAVDAAGREVRRVLPRLTPEAAEMAALAALRGYILKQAELAFTRPDILEALQSELPFAMVKLIDKHKVEEAALLSALPLVAEVVQAADPDGSKPFFQYDKATVLRIGEAFVAAWIEAGAQSQTRRGPFPDDKIPF